MPIVAVDAMRQAFFRDAGAHYGDILYWSKPPDWKSTTPNASARYIYFNFNLKDGPLVLDVPAAEGAGLFGSIVDAWEVPVADLGVAGIDGGKGGKYMLIPPGSMEPIPQEDLHRVRFETFNGYSLLRAMSASSADEDVASALDLVKRLRLYPLARASDPPPQKYIDMAGKRLDGVVQFDESFFERLARMVNEEPILPRDFLAMGQLRAIGIEKGRRFKADAVTRPILRAAAADALASFMLGAGGGIAADEARTGTSSRKRGQRRPSSFRPTRPRTSRSQSS